MTNEVSLLVSLWTHRFLYIQCVSIEFMAHHLSTAFPAGRACSRLILPIPSRPAISQGAAVQFSGEWYIEADSGRYKKIGWLKQHTCISHSCGAWEVQDQGTNRCGFWWEPSSRLADVFLMWWRESSGLSSSPSKDTNSIMGPTLTTSYKPTYL